MAASRFSRIFALVAVIALFGFAATAQPAAAEDGGVVCTASGECGDWGSDPQPTFCYWAVPAVVDGYDVALILYPYEESGPYPSGESAFVYCESGL